MTEFSIGSTERQSNILEYLKSLRMHPGSLDVQVKSATRIGVLHLRQGQVIAAECGNLQGNGAFLTLVSMGIGNVRSVKALTHAEKNVSITLSQIERFFAQLPGISQGENHCDEERTLQEAIRLFFQFRRKEAGAKLVEVLRGNRFYYPAWLWHSRLMTREGHIQKALNEARKWGNVDKAIKKEVAKIEPQLTGSPDKVKRCIFCWSLVRSGEDYCGNCKGLQRITKQSYALESATEELLQALSLYEEELLKSPENLRIVYCLCLGFYSVGRIDRAREFIERALKISPREPLFVRTSALLNPVQSPVWQPSAQKVVVQQDRLPKRGVGNVAPSYGGQRIGVDKTILVVEDSKTARKVVSLVLGRKGYNVIEASSGTEALMAIEGVPPDLILLDVMLPDMSGYEVLAAIRKSKELSEVPVVMLTGKSGAADRQKGIFSGSNEYLTKPFDPAKLLSVLGKYLESPATAAIVPAPETSSRVEQPPTPIKPKIVEKPAIVREVVSKPTVLVPKVKGGERSVLVVEDSPTSRKVITMVLARNGYTVSEAATGEQALRTAGEETPRLILLDAMLPDMTGYDILAKLKQDQRLKDIPVVMLTAKDSPLDREKGMRAGSVAYLTKPFNPDKLLSVIGDYI